MLNDHQIAAIVLLPVYLLAFYVFTYLARNDLPRWVGKVTWVALQGSIVAAVVLLLLGSILALVTRGG